MFCRLFKKPRKEKDMTQKDIATYLNVSDRLVGYYESGERMPPPDILEKFADYFDVSVDYLLGRTNIRKQKQSVDSTVSEIKDDIDNLSPESKDDLKRYLELLKIKDMQERNSNGDEIKRSE